MKRRYVFIPLAIYIIVLPVILFILGKLFLHSPQENTFPTLTPTSESGGPTLGFPTSTISRAVTVSPTGPTPLPLSIVDTSPTNGQQDVPSQTAILIQFNQSIQGRNIPFSISPSFPYSVTTQNKVLTITPKQPLVPNTTFNLYLRLNNSISSYSFTTAPAPIPTASPTTDQSQSDTESYVASRMPFDLQNKYGASASFQSGHYVFTVTAHEDQAAAKSDFHDWLISIGLTDSQIQSLTIVYQ